MEKLKSWLRDWLGVTNKEYVLGILAESFFTDQVNELKQRIQDLEDAYPGYKQAKEEADAKPEPIVQGFVPFSKRKRTWERDHRRTEKK